MLRGPAGRTAAQPRGGRGRREVELLPRDEQHGGHGNATQPHPDRPDPRLGTVGGEQPFDDDDRRDNADGGVEDGQVGGDEHIDVPDNAVVADPDLGPVAGVVPEPVGQALLVHAVGRAEQEEPWPSEPVPMGDLTTQQGPAAVHADEQREVPRQQHVEGSGGR